MNGAERVVAQAPAFVSRGGIKLANALAATGLEVRGRGARESGAWTGGCTDCGHGPAGACPGHVADTGRAVAYRQLAAAVARALPEMAGEER